MTSLLKFELATYFKRPMIYIALILLGIAGFLMGYNQLSLNAGQEIYKNAPYSIAAMIGFLSLAGIFTTTLLAGFILFKEDDASFSVIIYATPITKLSYLASRFLAMFILSTSCLLLMVFGFGVGQSADPDSSAYTDFRLWAYVQPFLIFSLPNLFLCCAILSSVAWSTKNKVMVFLCGLFLYILYMVLLVYSGSPLMAAGLPQSSRAMALSAQIDPLGISAFYHQTNDWILVQKNTSFLSFTGVLLYNRLAYFLLSATVLLTVFKTFKFSLENNKSRHKNENEAAYTLEHLVYKPVNPHPKGIGYQICVLKSMVTLDLNTIMKSLPFALIALSLVFYMSMEFYGTIDQGIRLPEQYASTALMTNRILYNLPGILILVILFYVHDLFWRSEISRFSLIENSTPAQDIMYLTGKWLSLSAVVLLLITLIICLAVAFQFIYDYNFVDWPVYGMLYWLIAAPLLVSIGITLAVQTLINHRWVGLLISCAILLLLATSLGKSAGLSHPLVRFAVAYSGKFSEMNGWGNYLSAFSIRLIFGMSVTLFFITITKTSKSKRPIASWKMIGLFAVCTVTTGLYITFEISTNGEKQQLDDQQNYELDYRKYTNITQPTITEVKTSVDLYPEKNSYRVLGTYRIKNTTNKPIEQLLITFDNTIMVEKACYQSPDEMIELKPETNLTKLKRPLSVGDTALFHFSFSYQWNGFNGHDSFNSIIENGSFIRLSNFFPRFGYQEEMEIKNLRERRNRQMANATPLKKLEAPRNLDQNFIKLDMTVSTKSGQTVIGVGELTKQWQADGRNYFRYQTPSAIPFRFAISSAEYEVKRALHKGVSIEVYYHPNHFENVAHLIKNAIRTMDYCQANFSSYPFRVIRFAEVSQFTEGFAATAYPASIFMTENMTFHANLKGDKGQDVITELAGHELSHQWWGANQLVPDEREGSKLLTETLAMYTELMMLKYNIGKERMRASLDMHKQIYQSDKGLSTEEPLYKVKPESVHLHYSKGVMAMYHLSELIGEKNINKALRNLLVKHAYPNPPPVSTDLLDELNMVRPPWVNKKEIDQLFDR